ncbi:MAG: hypothetical protein J6Y47_02750, partial [Bacteroidales bacterium]|nr:hypothetical protein [Bacteroidales bacterium]
MHNFCYFCIKTKVKKKNPPPYGHLPKGRNSVIRWFQVFYVIFLLIQNAIKK